MNTTTTTIRHRWATVAAVAGTAVGFPSVAIAGPQPIADPTSTVRTDERPSSTVDHEHRTTVNHTAFRPCFIIQSHWNPAYDGFVPVCERP